MAKKTTRKADTPSFIINQATVVDILCTNRTTLHNWEHQHGFPRNEDGNYDLSDIIPWILDYYREMARGKSSEALEEQRRIKAELYALELQKKTGEVLDKSEVERNNIEKILAVKQALLGMGSKLAPILANRDSREIKVELDREVREIITEFSGQNQSTTEEI